MDRASAAGRGRREMWVITRIIRVDLVVRNTEHLAAEYHVPISHVVAVGRAKGGLHGGGQQRHLEARQRNNDGDDQSVILSRHGSLVLHNIQNRVEAISDKRTGSYGSYNAPRIGHREQRDTGQAPGAPAKSGFDLPLSSVMRMVRSQRTSEPRY